MLKQKVFYCLLLVCVLALIPAQSFAEVIRDVVLVGNTKTTRRGIIRHGLIHLGREISAEEINEIKERLRRINQFILKNLSFKDGVLTVEIEDKWSLFPVPMITQSGSYYSRGFLIYENNFLGSLGTFAPAMAWTNSGFNGLLYFQDESFFMPQAGFKILLLRKSDPVYFRRHGSIVSSYESRYDTILFTPNYLYKRHVFKGGPIYVDKSIYDKNGVHIFRDKGAGLFLRHHLNQYQMTDTQMDGFVTTYNLIFIHRSNGDTIVFHEGDAKLSIPYLNHFSNFEVHGHHVNDNSYLYPKIIGGNEGYRGYDKASFPAQWNIGALAQFQYNFYPRVFLAPFYEYNYSKLIKDVLNGKTIAENTLGIGVRYYFKKISIPAVIFDVSRNFEDRSTHLLVNIGLSL